MARTCGKIARPVHVPIQAARSPAGSEPGAATRARTAYSWVSIVSATRRVIAAKTEPSGLARRRERMKPASTERINTAKIGPITSTRAVAQIGSMRPGLKVGQSINSRGTLASAIAEASNARPQVHATRTGARNEGIIRVAIGVRSRYLRRWSAGLVANRPGEARRGSRDHRDR